jgi:PUA-domain protein
MPTKNRRYPLKTKEANQILNKTSTKLKLNIEAIFGAKSTVEVIESDVGLIYLIAGKPVFFKSADEILPMLTFDEFVAQAPKIVVDMGAVPYVCKGADVMAPGIRRIEGEFSTGDIVVVVDEKHGKALALGEGLYDAATARSVKKGAVVKTFHYVSDKIWDYAKALVE